MVKKSDGSNVDFFINAISAEHGYIGPMAEPVTIRLE